VSSPPVRIGRAGWVVGGTPLRWSGLIPVVLAFGVLLRLVYLDADPDYYAWVGYMTDEGRWVAHARELVLFGHLVNAGWLLHLMLAPLFQGVSFVVFSLLGVSLWSSRLFTAVSGSMLLVLYWWGLRRVVAPRALLAGLALLAFDVDLLMLSRVAVPEVPAMVLELGVYLAVVLGRPTRMRRFLAGLLLFAVVAMKATTLVLVPIFSLLVLLDPRWRGPDETRGAGVIPFWAGLVTPLALLLAVLPFTQTAPPAVGANLQMLRYFVGINTRFIAFPFETDFGPVFNAWALALCLVTVAWLARRGEPVDPLVRRVFLSAGTWSLLHTAAVVIPSYFPDRYRVHVLVPMAVAIAAGLTGVATVSVQNVADTLRGRGTRSALAVGLLGLPTAAFWAPVPAGLVALAGVDTTHLRIKLVCLITVLAVVAWGIRRASRSGTGVVHFLLVYPIVGTLIWLVGLRSGLLDGRFWPGPHPDAVPWWMIGPWVSCAAAALLIGGGRAWSHARWAALVPAAALCYGALVLARVVPSYVHPQYTMKHISAALGASLAGSRDIVVSRADSLFNGNAVPYRTTLGRMWPRPRPEHIVIAFRFIDPESTLSREYELVATYRLFVSPEYEDERSETLDTVNHQEFVQVYVRRPG
jgi:hypothetical protein